MAQITEKSDMAKLYTRLTGLTYNLDELIEDCADEKEKVELFEMVLWNLKRGTVLPDDNELAGEYALGFKNLVTELKSTLGIATSGDIDLDGDSDEDDARIAEDINKASTITVEIPDDSDERNGVTGVDIE